MRSRWMGCLIVAWLAGDGAALADRPALKAADPMPPELAAVARPAASPILLDAKSLASLTDDPLLAKADRIDGDEASGVVAFTFDDGPNPDTTPAVIDALDKYNIPATFFIVTRRITGKHGEKSREILERELTSGYLIGSHSVTHPNLKRASARSLEKEIDASIRTLAPQANRPIGMFRPPYGALGGAGAARLKKLGLTNVLWSVDTLDWKAKNAEKLRKKVLKMIIKQNGGVVLMHDVKPITASIIAEVLDDLEAENCQRLTDKKDPILPVSLHYFMKVGKAARAIPTAVRERTEAYRTALPGRCALRPPTPKPVVPVPFESKPATANPVK